MITISGSGPGGSRSAGSRPRLLERHAAFLPVSAATPRLTLGEGFTPLVHGHPETVATAIRIGNPASWARAVAARDESGGALGWRAP